jgi:hypothetical protein
MARAQLSAGDTAYVDENFNKILAEFTLCPDLMKILGPPL